MDAVVELREKAAWVESVWETVVRQSTTVPKTCRGSDSAPTSGKGLKDLQDYRYNKPDRLVENREMAGIGVYETHQIRAETHIEE